MLRLGLYNNPVGHVMLFLVNPIGIVILVNYMKTLPKELDEAAAIDGCGYLRFVGTMVIPLSQPAIATVAVLHAIGIWNELILPTIYLTEDSLYPITRGLIVFEGVYGSDWPKLAAAVLMLAIPIITRLMPIVIMIPFAVWAAPWNLHAVDFALVAMSPAGPKATTRWLSISRASNLWSTPRSWLTTSNVFRASVMLRMSSKMASSVAASTPAKGSSNSMTSGSVTSVRANATRFASPPDSSVTGRVPKPASPTRASHATSRPSTA